MPDAVTHRWYQALWYAYGRKDAGQEVDASAFADFARTEAEQYHSGTTHYLDGIMEQYRRFTNATV